MDFVPYPEPAWEATNVIECWKCIKKNQLLHTSKTSDNTIDRPVALAMSNFSSICFFFFNFDPSGVNCCPFWCTILVLYVFF